MGWKRVVVGIKIFAGEDRIRAQAEILRVLGEGYEVFEGENLTASDLPGIFLGATLFSTGVRKILVKDLGENREVFGELAEKIGEYGETEAEVILWESKLDKRLAAVKELVKAGVEVQEFKAQEPVDMRKVFDIYNIALRDGAKAVAELAKIEGKQDPYMFFGLMVSQALKKLEWKPNGVREKRILKELSAVDMQMKSTAVEPWMLVKSFLLRVATL